MSTKTERPSLANLPLTRKTSAFVAEPETAAPEPEVVSDHHEAEPASSPPAAAKRAKAKPDDKVVLMVRVSRAERKRIRQIAVATDTTVQALVEEAVKDIVRRHRVRPVS